MEMGLPLLLLLLLVAVAVPSSSAQSCKSQTFSNNKLYATCSSLPELSATLHWTYYAANGTADVAFRVPQDVAGWAAWAINPKSSAMINANAIFAFHDSAGAVTVISSVLDSYSPTVKDGNLTFPVYSRAAEYSGGAYTIYATVGLPGNRTQQNTVWQTGDSFQSGVPSGHPMTAPNTLTTTTLDFVSGDSASAGAGGASSSRQHRKNIHGVLSAVSWGVLLPLGIIMARYVKPWADPAWFYLHITCQCSGYILGVAGWGLGLKLGSESKGITYHSHRIIGIVLFCLATLQVFALLLRPKKDHKIRVYWNVYHHSIGYLVVLLGIINIFKGFNILNPDNKWKHAYIAVIVTLGGVGLVLEVLKWGVYIKRRSGADEKMRHAAGNGANGSYGVRQHQGV